MPNKHYQICRLTGDWITWSPHQLEHGHHLPGHDTYNCQTVYSGCERHNRIEIQLSNVWHSFHFYSSRWWNFFFEISGEYMNIIPDFKPNFSKYHDYTLENLLPEIPLCKTSCLKFHSVKPLAWNSTLWNLLVEIPLCKTSWFKFHSVKPLAWNSTLLNLLLETQHLTTSCLLLSSGTPLEWNSAFKNLSITFWFISYLTLLWTDIFVYWSSVWCVILWLNSWLCFINIHLVSDCSDNLA